MAYRLPLQYRCERSFCTLPAAFTVYNHRHEKRGQFCKRHAVALVKSMDFAERSDGDARKGS